ncbi:RcnB family protein [Breoghania sp.]|uniref:RcnB family protein n=1 Tax=Breoghania sp. TaxID=2065378 RepID=UPI002610BE75|nr:RcnB family protein [Breoghania sp.]MDJ0930954.1 RcnB family protein [Breoghania sp.]
MQKFKILLSAVIIGLSAAVAANPVLAASQNRNPGEGPELQSQKKKLPQKAPSSHKSKPKAPSSHHQKPAKKKPSHQSWMEHGGHMPKAYRGKPVDYHRHHLKKPPEGYHWVRHGDK